ncbi:MAG: efflux RND transporter permease subunit [Ketobacteraceae bacterium]|nr:efflux RND transporter permease subunit [Ketobacteraceae bacterium]
MHNKNNSSEHTSGFPARLASCVTRYPALMIIASLIVVAISATGFSSISYVNDPRAMFTEAHEGLKGLEALEQQFTRDDNVMFIVHPANNDMFTRENLSLLKELTEAAWTLPQTLRVDSLINFQHTDVSGDDLYVRNLVEKPGALTNRQLATIKSIALSEPFLVNNVVSESGHVAAVSVMVTMGEQGSSGAPAIQHAAEAIRNRFQQKYPDVDIMISGMVPYHAASQQTTETEMSTTSVYTSVAIFICLWLMLRSLVLVLLTFLVITLSNVIAVGGILMAGVELTPVMAGAPAIILTLAVADSIHLLMTYQQLMAAGRPKTEAVFESVRVNFQPVLLTSLTTAIGFLLLNSSKSPPFADMANMVVIGVTAALLLSLFFLPALLILLPTGRYRKRQGSRLMEALAGVIIRRRLPVFAVTGVVCLALASQSFNNQLNDVWFEYFDDSYPVRSATEFMVEELTGHHRVMFAFPSGEPDGIMAPEYMQALDNFAQWARRHPNVKYVSSFSDTIKRLNRDMNGGQTDFYRVPDNRELISQYALMYQLSLPFGLGLENQININRSATRVNVLLGLLSASEIKAFASDANAWIKTNLPTNMHTEAVAFDLLLGDLGYENGRSMLVGTAVALVLVSVLLLFAMRSVKYGFLSLLPNLFPALIAFGIWAYIDGYIGISVSIVACMTLGIIIDDTVHFLSKYKRAREELGFGPEEAVRYTFRTVGVALVATTLVIAANFGVMATSHYYPNSSMGLLTSITVIIALIVNFFIFVPVLLFVEERQNRRGVNLSRPLPDPS